VLDDDHRARRREATLWASTGHAAAVYGDELYDALPQTRGGYGYLQDFGIRFGYERVVLHLQPHAQPDRLACNTARTLLLFDHEPLPWARWGEEFAATMPDEILQLQERAARVDALPRHEAIRNRVKAILPLYRLSRYRRAALPREAPIPPAAGGRQQAPDMPTTEPAARRQPTAEHGAAEPTSGQQAPIPVTESPDEDRHDEQRLNPRVWLPDVAWISARDGSRAVGDLEDQAARYHQGRNELTVNADFRAITDLIAHWHDRYRGVAGARTVIEAHVREWCEQILVEVVLAACSSSWNDDQLERATVADLVHGRPAGKTVAARDPAEAARPETRSPTKRSGHSSPRRESGAAQRSGAVSRAPRDVLTPKEVAERTGFSYHAILRAIRRGDLQAFERVHGHYRIEFAEYERWLRTPARRKQRSDEPGPRAAQRRVRANASDRGSFARL
jgi:excisionase family DNA binding protein